MATVEQVQQAVADAITAAEARTNDALTRSDTAIQQAKDAVGLIEPGTYTSSWVVIGPSSDLSPADIIPNDIPDPNIPTTDFSGEVRTAFDYAFGTFNQSIQPQITEYITTFFPDIAAAVKTGSDQWIIDTMTNGRFVPAAVEDAMWNRARDKELNDSLRAEQAVVDATASRGFSMPVGEMTHAIRVNSQDTQKRLAAINRDIAVKVFDVANENSKFAVDQAVRLRTAFVAALGDFIKTAMIQPNNAVEYAKTILASKTAVYDTMVRLYATQIDEERMRTGVLGENQNKDMRFREWATEDDRAMKQHHQNLAKIQADVALSAAETLAKIAVAAQSTRNTMTSVSAGV